KHQKHDTGSTLQFIPSLDATPGFYAPAPPFPAPPLPALTELDIDTNTFVGEPDFDKYETESNSVSAMFEHNLNDMLTLTTNTRYWKSESTYQYTQAIGYSFAPPYLPALVPTLPPLTAPGDVYRLHYASEKELEIFANNLALKANGNWLGLEHNAQIGLDYVKADTVDDRARDPVLEALYQTITMNPNAVLPGAFLADSKINLLDPQYSGATTIPTTREYRDSSNEQIGLYLGDIMRAGNVIASVNVRYDRVKQSFDRVGIYGAADSTSYSDTLEDVNTDFALMYQFENGISPYYSYAESFTPNDADQNGNLVDPNEGSQHEIGVKFLS
ncbi:TonB-dependent receptor domain-containing protein, partial [Oleiphilus sp. HI0067]